MVRTKSLRGYSDVHMTDEEVAKKVIAHFKPSLPCLEPCCGDGVFLRNLPVGTQWCEITKGVDFFEYDGMCKWIITNPPFEELTKWMEKALMISDNVVFVIPLSKFFSSAPRIELAMRYGWIKEILYLGRGRSIGFDIGFPFGAVHFEAGYKGQTKFTFPV